MAAKIIRTKETKNYSQKNQKLTLERYFTNPGKTLPIKYVKSDVRIVDEEGAPLFVQKGVEFPNFYSELAKQVVASRYFYGEHGTTEREHSMKQLVDRVTSGSYEQWAFKEGYMDKKTARIFKEELASLFLNQKVSPNSPVWFNNGAWVYESRKSKDKKEGWIMCDKNQLIDYETNITDPDTKKNIVVKIPVKKGQAIPVPLGKDHLYPQTSACFIQQVGDTMEDIMQLAVNEAMLFKYGSGTGSDLSTLRSSKEKLSGGGKPSGPKAYLIFYDDVAGIVKSGGKTRRAAKMDSIRIDHPDIKEFVEAKSKEEKKVRVMIKGGIDPKEAVETVHFQNTNMSIRVNDEFMRAAEENKEWQTIPVHNKELAKDMPKYNAKDLFNLIAKGTWECGDPGIQFHDTINRWHTCKNSGPIRASNPCSEYMFVDDSSCNLASLNLMGFVDEKGIFNVRDFKKAIETVVFAMDLNYDNSSFPTKQIAQNSHDFRPLGLGYSNLGALIMSLGLPYDSNEARAIAGAITSLMTATAYETSIKMAKKLGAFKKFKENKESMMEVIKMHSEAAKGQLTQNVFAVKDKITGFNLEEILLEGNETWSKDEKDGNKYGFRNAQATVLAPTGTISFLMDCDTTGIEPELALVKQKLLAEGGILRIVNGIVPIALKKLGYNENKIEKIKEYIDKNKTVEGCDVLKEEHLPVFDCSFKPKGAKREIHYMGHIKMMAAVQPFLSGAISKTVNMPKDATPEDIENVYKAAWKLGLKAVAIYRDQCKPRQPLSFVDNDKLEERVGGPIRRKLPDERHSITHTFDVAGHEGYITVGLYEDGTPGEAFVTMAAKEGTTTGGLMGVIGKLTSFLMQYGVPLEAIVNKLKGDRFEPYGETKRGHEKLLGTESTSLTDYYVKYLELKFIKKGETENPANQNQDNQNGGKEELGRFCICGKRMVKKGSCDEVCPSCGFVVKNGCGK